MNKRLAVLLLLATPLLLSAAANQKPTAAEEKHAHAAPTRAVAVMHPTQRNKAHGVLYFDKEGDGVRVQGVIRGLTANGKHAFHIHQWGDCSDNVQAMSAGGHFNPHNKPHGARDAEERHVGDLGNLQANGKGEATVNFVDKMIALDGANSIIGRSVIIHAKADDFSQPVGNAGGRIACGVVGIGNPNPPKPK